MLAPSRSYLFRSLIVWLGQLVSLVGSGLTSFAVGVWVYTRTGSVSEFSLVLVFGSLPGVIVAPFAGAIVDRQNRAAIMMISDFAGAANAAILAFLFLTGHLAVWEVCILVAASSVEDAFRVPAYTALTSQLVPAKQLGRASGFMQIGPAVMQVCSPVLAAALIGFIGFHGVVLIDVSTFVVAIASLFAIGPFDLRPAASSTCEKSSLLREAYEGWRYIAERPGLLRLVFFFTFINISYGFSQVLLTPMILGFVNIEVLGRIMSAGAAGFLVGSIGVSVWGGPQRKVAGLFAFALLYGLGFVLIGLKPSTWLVSAGLFLLTLQMPLLNSCSQTIWQRKTPLWLQGRVFGFRMMIAWIAMPLAFFLAGPLADKFFSPLQTTHGTLAGAWTGGIGPGRGSALFLVLIGILSLLISTACFSNRRLWYVEQELPDALVQDRGLTGDLVLE